MVPASTTAEARCYPTRARVPHQPGRTVPGAVPSGWGRDARCYPKRDAPPRASRSGRRCGLCPETRPRGMRGVGALHTPRAPDCARTPPESVFARCQRGQASRRSRSEQRSRPRRERGRSHRVESVLPATPLPRAASHGSPNRSQIHSRAVGCVKSASARGGSPPSPRPHDGHPKRGPLLAAVADDPHDLLRPLTRRAGRDGGWALSEGDELEEPTPLAADHGDARHCPGVSGKRP